MPVMNPDGKVVKLEGGDIATIALMAAWAIGAGAVVQPEDAEDAVKSYTAVVEQVNKFNRDTATKRIAAIVGPQTADPQETVAKLLAQMSAAVNTVPNGFRTPSAWYRDAEKMLKAHGYVKNRDDVWALKSE